MADLVRIRLRPEPGELRLPETEGCVATPRIPGRMRAALFCSLVAALAGAHAAFGAVQAQTPQLRRGVNVLGYDPIWNDFAKARFQARHFQLIRQAGFETVRVNLHPFSRMGPAPEFRITDDWYGTLDWIVSNGLKNHLNVILDLHEFGAMGEDPEGLKPKFVAFWRQIAARFRSAPPEVIFEVLNEPNKKLGADLWNEYLAEALQIIRRENPARTVIVGPANWNSIEYLEKLKLPEDDRHLIVTVHFYEPMRFTHQGASWAGLADRTGVEWTGTPEEVAAITNRFQKAQDWAKAHRRPIFLGEFGAYDKAPMESRARWDSAVARAAERNGWSWAYWQFDSDFVLYDIPNDHWVEPILKALVP